MLGSHLSTGLTPFAAAFTVLRKYNGSQEQIEKFYYFLFVCFFGVISLFVFCKKVIVKSSSIALLTVNLGFSLGIPQQDQSYSRNMLV